jgi:asparagine synthase (glutamine-hydrolysing)
MCGIAAIFAYGEAAPPVDRDEVMAMRERMFSRGPDGAGEWFSEDGRVGLGHRRLSIIDLSPAGAQPMFNADRSLALIFNGEIYNYRELRSQLSDKGYQFQSHCDAEVVLGLYATCGIDAMLNKLRGMYAFAIWDRRKQGILLARDPFGIKPLYYSDNGHTFRLASQVKALRAGGKIDPAPDPAGHVGFFLWGHVPDPYTLYRNIRSLPAGSTMWVDRFGPKSPRTFCNISSILADAEKLTTEKLKSGNTEKSEIRNPKSEIQEANSQLSTLNSQLLRSALAETVKHHLVADVPVGVFLSSGLDSTTIAALAAEQGGNLRTVTLGFEEYKGTEADETPLAEQFAKRCGATHQTIWVSRADFEAERDHLFEAMDRPSTDGVNTFFVSLAAKQANLKVALSGVGGDELFATYPSFRDIPWMVKLFKPVSPYLPTFAREFRMVTSPILKRFTSPKYAGIFEYGGSYSGAYLLRRGMFMPWELPDLLDPDFVKQGWAELQTLLRLEETLDDIRNPRLKISALELQWYMRHQLLRDSDWGGMGHSVEIRVPFVDVEFLKQIAPMLSRPNAPSKRDMAAAASKLMTPEILDRRKTGFQIPVRDWLLTDQPAHAIDSPYRIADRGLRGWAKHVYRRFGGAELRSRSQKSAVRSQTREVRQQISAFQPVSVSDFPTPPRRILVFRIGQLGDTIVALPAMWVVRKSFPDAHIALLCDRHTGKSHVVASSLLRGSTIFDDYLSYPVSETTELWRKSQMARLLGAIRARRFDTLVYLAPNNRKPEQIARDRNFFRMAGIRNFIGMRGFESFEPKQPGEPMPLVLRESELLLHRLAVSGLTIAAADANRMDLGLGPDDEAPVHEWLSGLPNDGARVWIAVGPASKMPAKRWPLRRFEKLVKDLIAEFDIWPVVFGGEEDKMIGDWLLEHWGRGYNAAGALGLRSGLAAMKRCHLFVGNDTGTMHMAAAVGLRCVAIFSSRERPGLWYPHGEGHRVFRTTIECEGCGLVECLERGNECINRITTDEVLSACRDLLATSNAPGAGTELRGPATAGKRRSEAGLQRA